MLHVDDLYDLIRLQIADLDALRRRGATTSAAGAAHSVSLAELTALCRERGRPQRVHRVRPADERRRRALLRHRQRGGHRGHRLGAAPRRSATLLDDVFAWLREHRATLEPVLSAATPVAAALRGILNHVCRPHHRRVRPHRLRGRALLRQQGFDVVGIDNDMRRYFFGDEASTTWRNASGSSASVTRLPPRRRRHPRRGGDRRSSRRTARDDRARHPHRRAAVARLGGARAASPTSRSTPTAR